MTVDLEVTRRRVAMRHVRAGIEENLADAYKRVDGNDAVNGKLVSERVCEGVDVVVESLEDAGVAGENGFEVMGLSRLDIAG